MPRLLGLCLALSLLGCHSTSRDVIRPISRGVILDESDVFTAADRACRAKLDQTIDVDWKNELLAEAFLHTCERLHVNAYVEPSDGPQPDATRITFRGHEMKALDALDLLSRRLPSSDQGPRLEIRHGVLLLTARPRPVMRAYDVRDLVDAATTRCREATTRPSEVMRQDGIELLFNSVVEPLSNNEPFRDLGGGSGLQLREQAGSIFLRVTQFRHESFAVTLDRLRDAWGVRR